MNEFQHPGQYLKPPDQKEPPASKKTARDESAPKKKNQRSWLKHLLLIIAYGLLVFIVLLAGAGLALTYYFPSERLRPIAEEKLSELLKIPVSIQYLDLNILHGITISRLTLGENNPIFEVKNLVLDYDLTELMQGRFVINQVLVDKVFYVKERTTGV